MGFNSRFLRANTVASDGDGGGGSGPGASRGTAFMANQGAVSSPNTDYAGVDIGGHYKYFWPSASDTGTALTNSDRGTYFWFTDSSNQVQVYYDGTIGSNYVFITVQQASGPAFGNATLHDN